MQNAICSTQICWLKFPILKKVAKVDLEYLEKNMTR